MSTELLTPTRELNSRITDGIQVQLLWCGHDGRLWVALLDTRTGDSFSLEVRDGERPLDVFHHPYACAAHHGIDTRRRPRHPRAVPARRGQYQCDRF